MKAGRLPIEDGKSMQRLEKLTESGFERYRVLVLTSPVWLAAAMTIVGLASPQFRHVLQFITSSPLR